MCVLLSRWYDPYMTGLLVCSFLAWVRHCRQLISIAHNFVGLAISFAVCPSLSTTCTLSAAYMSIISLGSRQAATSRLLTILGYKRHGRLARATGIGGFTFSYPFCHCWCVPRSASDVTATQGPGQIFTTLVRFASASTSILPDYSFPGGKVFRRNNILVLLSPLVLQRFVTLFLDWFLYDVHVVFSGAPRHGPSFVFFCFTACLYSLYAFAWVSNQPYFYAKFFHDHPGHPRRLVFVQAPISLSIAEIRPDVYYSDTS